MIAHRYDPAALESKWQQRWEQEHAFRTPEPGTPEFDSSKPKYYVLDMFPYPSGAGLHVGHPEGYTATDILARYKRACGYNVLHPMGWDAFGLPAEQYAIQTGTHPSVTTQKNIETFRRQLQALGFSYDWERELATTDVRYVRWTQWIFQMLFDTWYDETAGVGRAIAELPIPPDIADVQSYIDSKRLAYLSEIPVWWCAELGTVLANEEVIDGRSERGSYPCVRLPLKQWMLRITAYAGRLLRDLDVVEWPEETKKQQAEWIGESHGADVWFGSLIAGPVELEEDRIRRVQDEVQFKIFTTRPDTLFGATFVVLAPEHPLVAALTTPEQASAVLAYQRQAASKSDLDRTASKEKSGVWTGGYSLNPVNGQKVPVWIADYVLATYGSGAIMAVPAHDERDHEFAQQFGLPIVAVIQAPPGVEEAGCFCGHGTAINSPWIDGQATADAQRTMVAKLEQMGRGRARTTYRLRDWIFSRQRYWGEPFPLLHLEDGRVVASPTLPVELPEMADFRPSGNPEPPLAKAHAWVNTSFEGQPARRETNTMPNWAGSCWYYLRFLDPHNDAEPWDREKERYWMPVDLYVGGREHAVLHLLYARFWHKVLFDRGYVTHPEPFKKLFHQGLILAFSFQDQATKVLVASDLAEELAPEEFVHRDTRAPLQRVVAKMSKTLKNVVNPDDILREYGADAFRMYEMFMGPLETAKPWNTKDIGGVSRFLNRAYRLLVDEDTGERKASLRGRGEGAAPVEKALQKCLKKVTEDLDRMAFNTAVSAMMIFLNEVGSEALSLDQGERFVQILAPFAPHLGEELWSKLGHADSLSYAPWPLVDESVLHEDTLELPVQVNGKLRAKVVVAMDADNATIEAQARAAVSQHLEGKTIKKVVIVPKRMVSVVVG